MIPEKSQLSNRLKFGGNCLFIGIAFDGQRMSKSSWLVNIPPGELAGYSHLDLWRPNCDERRMFNWPSLLIGPPTMYVGCVPSTVVVDLCCVAGWLVGYYWFLVWCDTQATKSKRVH